ncbi:ABC transporter permease [Arthrobacter sp. ISL-30]|uniref:ABC transporter permease n=1 Tax=Arthrobacter sp. ISL-30 TaxID=2819109 RepID=UPI0035B4C529
MSTVTMPATPMTAANHGPGRWASDGWTVTKRNLTKMKRSPDMLLFAVLQPIMFVLLFSQVYGGSIKVEGSDYTQFLMAGIFGQTVVFGATFSGAAMAQDLKEGIIDRFRTLPMSSSAVLIGRTNADLVPNAISMLIMIGTGLMVGWRVNTSLPEFLAGVGLLLLFSYAFSHSAADLRRLEPCFCTGAGSSPVVRKPGHCTHPGCLADAKCCSNRADWGCTDDRCLRSAVHPKVRVDQLTVIPLAVDRHPCGLP